jgi:hypothetical protein
MDNDTRLDRLFKWVDFVRVLLYFLVAGAVSVAVWCTKIQMSINELKIDQDVANVSAVHYRDIRHETEVLTEHRMSTLETDMEWLKRGH